MLDQSLNLSLDIFPWKYVVIIAIEDSFRFAFCFINVPKCLVATIVIYIYCVGKSNGFAIPNINIITFLYTRSLPFLIQLNLDVWVNLHVTLGAREERVYSTSDGAGTMMHLTTIPRNQCVLRTFHSNTIIREKKPCETIFVIALASEKTCKWIRVIFSIPVYAVSQIFWEHIWGMYYYFLFTICQKIVGSTQVCHIIFIFFFATTIQHQWSKLIGRLLQYVIGIFFLVCSIQIWVMRYRWTNQIDTQACTCHSTTFSLNFPNMWMTFKKVLGGNYNFSIHGWIGEFNIYGALFGLKTEFAIDFFPAFMKGMTQNNIPRIFFFLDGIWLSLYTRPSTCSLLPRFLRRRRLAPLPEICIPLYSCGTVISFRLFVLTFLMCHTSWCATPVLNRITKKTVCEFNYTFYNQFISYQMIAMQHYSPRSAVIREHTNMT